MRNIVAILALLALAPSAFASEINCANGDSSIVVKQNYGAEIFFNLYTANINLEGITVPDQLGEKADVEVIGAGDRQMLVENTIESDQGLDVFKQKLKIRDQLSKNEIITDTFVCTVTQ